MVPLDAGFTDDERQWKECPGVTDIQTCGTWYEVKPGTWVWISFETVVEGKRYSTSL